MNLFTSVKRLVAGSRKETSGVNRSTSPAPEHGMDGSGAATGPQLRDGSSASVPAPSERPPLVELPPPPPGRHRFGWAAPVPTRLIEVNQATWNRSRYFELAALDCSKSMFEAAGGQRRMDILLHELGTYFQRLSACGDLRPCLAVVWFKDEAVLGLPWTDRVGDVQRALPATMPAPGGTNFAAALRAVAAMLTARAFPPESHVVVRLYSDGLHLDPDEPGPLAGVVKKLGVEVHCIGCASTEADLDVELLKCIATRDEEGVPRYHPAGDNQSLREAFDGIIHGLERPQS